MHSQSKNFKMNDQQDKKIQYGKGAIAGHPSQDQGCFSDDSSSCMGSFDFLTVFKGQDMESLKGSGIFGLSPMPANAGEIDDPIKNGVGGVIA